MNMQLENMDSVLLEASLNISRRLDAIYNPTKTLRVLSQRDVPGMTHAVIATLLKNNIRAVSVGVNAGSYPPEVTREPFYWKTSSGSIIGIWHPGGYPNNPGDSPANPGGLSVRDCSMITGIPQVLCFVFRTDNAGPPESVQEVLQAYEITRTEFPGAEIIASTLEDFVTAISPYQEQMQVVYTEIGDTWIQGIASDPRKMAEYRAIRRVLTDCWTTRECNPEDPIIQNATRFLVKVPEHTWGLPSVDDNINYSNVAFNKQRNSKSFKNCDSAWAEQRHFNDITRDILKSKPNISTRIEQEIKKLSSDYPDLKSFKEVPFEESFVYHQGNFDFSFASDGSFNYLHASNNLTYATKESKMSRFVYRSYNEIDDKKLLLSYGNPGYGKPNVTMNANPESREWPYQVHKFYRKNSNVFLFELLPEDIRAVTDYGAPQTVFIQYVVANNISIELLLWNKTSTRLEEAIFLEFKSDDKIMKFNDCNWIMHKLGAGVDPMKVTYGGSVRQHAITDAVALFCDVKSAVYPFFIHSLDVPLVCPFNKFIEASPFPYLDRLLEVHGMSFNIFNNVWCTNYIFWYPYLSGDENFKSRFVIAIE